MQQSQSDRPSVQRDLQLLKWYGHKVVQHNIPRGQLRFTVTRNQLRDQVRSHRELCRLTSALFPRTRPDVLTLMRKIKQPREILAIGHPLALDAQLVEERVNHRLHSTKPRSRRILQQLGHQIYCLRRRARPEHLPTPVSNITTIIHMCVQPTFEKGCGLIWGNLCSM